MINTRYFRYNAMIYTRCESLQNAKYRFYVKSSLAFRLSNQPSAFNEWKKAEYLLFVSLKLK